MPATSPLTQRERLAELDADLTAGRIDADRHAALRLELERNLLADVGVETGVDTGVSSAPSRTDEPRAVSLVALGFALLIGTRAVDQLVSESAAQTLVVNDESWRLASTRETVRWMQHSFKLGRHNGQGNVLILHRLAELGGQADGAVGEIASRLVSDADIHIMFRQGDHVDAVDTVNRLVSTGISRNVASRMMPVNPIPPTVAQNSSGCVSGPISTIEVSASIRRSRVTWLPNEPSAW